MTNKYSFPLSIFTPPIREIIDDAHSSMGYPIEYLCASMLVAIAGAMGNNWSLQVKAGWEEKAIFYMAIVGNAGANKTHPMTFALSPLIALDIKRIAEATKEELYEAPPRTVVSDVTQEGLVKLHQKNHRGLILFIDELKAWVANFSRYSSGSQEQFWLSNFSRSPIIVDRKNDAQPISIPEPAISVIGSTQPSVLKSFAQGDKSTNGFIDRMLFVVKEVSDKAYWSDAESDLELCAAWEYLIDDIVQDEAIYRCEFTPEARAEAMAWQMQNTDMINACHSERLVGHYSKLEIYFVRFCLVLHALYLKTMIGVEPTKVSLETVQKAVALAEYFREQIHLVQEYLYPVVEETMSEKAKLLYSRLPQSFTRKEAVAIAKGAGISVAHSYRCLKDLEGLYIDKAEDGTFYKFMED